MALNYVPKLRLRFIRKRDYVNIWTVAQQQLASWLLTPDLPDLPNLLPQLFNMAKSPPANQLELLADVVSDA